MKLSIPVLVLSLVSFAASAPADELRFKNGDHLTGHFVSLVEKKVKFVSDVAGELEVDVAKVATFSTDESVEIHLSDETVLRDAAVAYAPAEQPEPAGVPQAPPAPEPAPAPEPNPAAELPSTPEPGRYLLAGQSTVGPKLLSLADTEAINPPVEDPVDWSGVTTVGIEFERGNSIKDEANTAFEVVRRTDESRLTAAASYDGERNTDPDTRVGSTVTRELKGRLKYDYFLTRRLYLTQITLGERDGVADLDLRLTIGAGVGMQWYDRKDFSFSTEVGLGWTDEHYEDDSRNQDFLTGLMGWELKRKLLPNLSFFHRGNWRPSFEDSHVMVIEATTGFRNELTSTLFLEAKNVWDWDSDPSSGKKRQDVDWIFGLGYRFD